MEFTADGKAIMTVDTPKRVVVAGAYNFLGDDMIQVDLSFAGVAKSQKFTVTVTEDTLTTFDEKNVRERMKRVK